MAGSASEVRVTHCGVVTFEHGEYKARSGSGNWAVQPITGFDPPIRAPLGQVQISFETPMTSDRYGVIVTPLRTPGVPLLAANYGDVDANGFVVHLFDPVTTNTVQNGNFSF